MNLRRHLSCATARAGLVLAVLAGSAAPIAAQETAPAVDPKVDAALSAYETTLRAHPDDLRAGSEYRQAIIAAAQYDRALAFFERLVTDHPDAANAELNLGFAYVDKIPAAGAITQVILANNALNSFTRSLDLRTSWIGLYTRGSSYLFWPKVFGRTQLGIDDLERAMAMQKTDTTRHAYYVRTYISLGDGYWKLDDLEKARTVWQEGLSRFPGNEPLRARLSRSGDALKTLIEDGLDPNKRVDTDLKELWIK